MSLNAPKTLNNSPKKFNNFVINFKIKYGTVMQ